MITVIKTTDMNFCGGLQKLKFEFEFDNGSSLPINTYQLGLTTYIIANGSTAKNIKDNTYYEYNDGEWVKTLGNVTPSTSTNIITENGNYIVSANENTGVSGVSVNVESGGGGGNIGGFNTVLAAYPRYNTDTDITEMSPFGIFTSDDGVYDISEFSYASTYGRAYLGNPMTSVVFGHSVEFIFTPSDSFDITTAFKGSDPEVPIIVDGDANPQPGDGRAYYAIYDDWGIVTIHPIAYANSGSTYFVFEVK